MLKRLTLELCSLLKIQFDLMDYPFRDWIVKYHHLTSFRVKCHPCFGWKVCNL